MMIAAYFDESSDEKQELVFAAGGFLGTNDAWFLKENEWKALLDAYGIEYYRASECEAGRGQFDQPRYRAGEHLTSEEWARLRQIRDRFIGVATSGGIVDLVAATDMRDFRRVANDAETLSALGGTPYYFTYHLAMLRSIEALWEKNMRSDTVAYVCDRNEQFAHAMLAVHGDLGKDNSDYYNQIGSLSFEDKRKFLPLQIADALVWEVRKNLQSEMIDPSAPEREVLQKLKGSKSIYRIDLCQEECLRSILAGYKQ